MFKDNLTFGYVLFVGIPLLILIGTLRASFNDTQKPTLAGHLESGHIVTTSSTSGCGTVLRLEAALTAKPGQRSMQGRLLFDGCDACAPVPFRANKSGK